MLTVEDYGRIRRAHRDGLSIRAIARTFGHSRRKIREALKSAEPQGYVRKAEPPLPRVGPFRGTIEQILKADEQAPRKQRHTAMQIFRRLRAEHGYAGSYTAIRRYVAKCRQGARETFIPLQHDPGQRLEADFGKIYVDFPEGRRQVAVLILCWSYSNCPFAVALPTERTEAILYGMVEGFEFFGCVPREVWWDNPKTVAVQIFNRRQRKLNDRYAALASHYAFDALFCMPAKGNEKPYVENRVYDLQRRWATPVPAARDLDALNAHLRRCCLVDRNRHVGHNTENIEQRFRQDQAGCGALPGARFDPCIYHTAKVDKFQTVRFDNNRYSVPRRHAFSIVTVKAYVDHIKIVAADQVIARHPRPYERGQQVLDPVHYLVTLGRRPAALDHAGVYRNWKLPAVFTELREALEQREGHVAGSKQYIRVLQLLASHPVDRVQKAIENCNKRHSVNPEAIAHQAARLANRLPHAPGNTLQPSTLSAAAHQVRVPSPDLNQFNQLLSLQGERAYA